jgi:HSP20 family protein
MQTETQAIARTDKAQDFYFTPRTDVYETADALVLVADVPGATEQGVEVTFEGDQLTIEAKVEPAKHEGFSFSLREYEVASYRRSFTVNTSIDRDGITAALVDGVLRVNLPKAKEAKVQKIQVRGA